MFTPRTLYLKLEEAMYRNSIGLMVCFGVIAAGRGTASAALTTIVNVPISAAAVADDPALANYQTWDLRDRADRAALGSDWRQRGADAGAVSASTPLPRDAQSGRLELLAGDAIRHICNAGRRPRS